MELLYLVTLFSVSLAFFILVFMFLTLAAEYKRMRMKRAYSHDKAKLPFVSILIPAHNEEKVIARTLERVLALDYPENKREVIVISNASTDRTDGIVQGCAGVRLISLKQPGKANAINVGLEKCRAKADDIIVILDADTYPEKSGLLKIVADFSDADIGAVASCVKVYERNALSMVESIEYLIAAVTKKIYAMADSLFTISGAFSAFRKKALLKVGGFSGDTITEDMDIALTLHKAGYRIEHDVDIVTYTEVPQTLSSLINQRLRWSYGHHQNLVKHADIFLSSAKRSLGLLFLPLTALSGFFGAILMLNIVKALAYSIKRMVVSFYYLNLVGFEFLVRPPQIHLDPYELYLSLNPASFMSIFLSVFGILSAVVAFMLLHEKTRLRDLPRLALTLSAYYILYVPLITLVFVAAMCKFLLKSEQRW